MSAGRALLLIDHGSRREDARRVVHEVAEQVRARAPYELVLSAHMELSPPTIEEAVERAAEAGVAELVVVPFFLGPGRHVSEDVPRLVTDATRVVAERRGESPLVVRWGSPLGADPLLAELVLRRAAAAD